MIMNFVLIGYSYCSWLLVTHTLKTPVMMTVNLVGIKQLNLNMIE